MEKKFAILKVEMKVTPNLINFEKWFIRARLGKMYKSNGLLSCTECNMILNRDVNGAMNIQHLLYNHLNRMQRPSWLTRN